MGPTRVSPDLARPLGTTLSGMFAEAEEESTSAARARAHQIASETQDRNGMTGGMLEAEWSEGFWGKLFLERVLRDQRGEVAVDV